jgi:alpha-amylase/alpha-mannosidase (GH57 family)
MSPEHIPSPEHTAAPEQTIPARTDVVLCWHMHQPEYRESASGRYHQPWTYLHGIKDYTDMAAAIEAIPEARAVVNFSPTLLEQIDNYARRLRAYLDRGEDLPDPVLEWLVAEQLPADPEVRARIAAQGLRANAQRLIVRFPSYARLAAMARQVGDDTRVLPYLSEQFFFDLLVWHHLAWCGESLRTQDARVRLLMAQETGFDRDHRRLLLAVIADALEGIIPRYRALAEQGRIELSVTPYSHPIMPLLLDLESAREAVPDLTLPHCRYPGGEARVHNQLERARAVFKRFFGTVPAGCWPSEGALSEAAVKQIGAAGFRWTASGQAVLHNSRFPVDRETPCIHHTYRLKDLRPVCFFRDDGLSDKIGFAYATWHAEDAVADLVHHLENIDHACHDRQHRVVSIILDGENCWEHYPHNGEFFLHALYQTLGRHPRFRLTTFSGASANASAPLPLARLVTGSWVYGTLTTWIGDPDKNRAWEMLCAAKAVYDEVLAAGELDAGHRELAERQLALCEASDWFWWFGDYNPATTVTEFDTLFRSHLGQLYQLLGRPLPATLSSIQFVGHGAPELGGVMRRGQDS